MWLLIEQLWRGLQVLWRRGNQRNPILRWIVVGFFLWPACFVAYALFPNRGLGYALSIIPLFEGVALAAAYPMITAAAVAIRPSRVMMISIFKALAWQEIAGLACIFLPARNDPGLMAGIVALVGVAVLSRGTLAKWAGVAALVLITILWLEGQQNAATTISRWWPAASAAAVPATPTSTAYVVDVVPGATAMTRPIPEGQRVTFSSEGKFTVVASGDRKYGPSSNFSWTGGDNNAPLGLTADAPTRVAVTASP